MKVEGPDRSRSAEQTRKKDKVSGGGGFSSLLTGGASEAGGTGMTQSIARVDVLLAAQAADDPAGRAASRRMRDRGEGVLKMLDGLRGALLTGQLTVGHVIDIADVVASHREKIMDPNLTAILDEIDLRAQVELAKMRAALDKASGI